jgi:hypothetical protein
VLLACIDEIESPERVEDRKYAPTLGDPERIHVNPDCSLHGHGMWHIQNFPSCERSGSGQTIALLVKNIRTLTECEAS